MTTIHGRLGASLIAGIASGLVALVAFFAVHAFVVGPELSLLGWGLLYVVPAGAAVGWGYHELRESRAFATHAIHGVAFGLLLWWLLVPLELLVLYHGGLGSQPGYRDEVRAVAEAALVFPLGVGVGWFIARNARAALATGLAAAALGVVGGAQLLRLGTTWAAVHILIGLLLVYALAGLGLVWSYRGLLTTRWMARRGLVP